jgi:UDP-2,3-diacylglucosamine pyrophosphatase LpxH
VCKTHVKKTQIIYSQKKREILFFAFKCQVQGISHEPAPKHWYIYLTKILILHQLCHPFTSKHTTIFWSGRTSKKITMNTLVSTRSTKLRTTYSVRLSRDSNTDF